jgi:hypothetical protein
VFGGLAALRPVSAGIVAAGPRRGKRRGDYLLAPTGVPTWSWFDVVVGIGSCIMVGGLAWRFVERPLGEVMRERLLRGLGLEPGDR